LEIPASASSRGFGQLLILQVHPMVMMAQGLAKEEAALGKCLGLRVFRCQGRGLAVRRCGQIRIQTALMALKLGDN
jgi:hypothetical protein